MVVTLFGIVMSVSPAQSANANAPILLTPSGITVVLHPEISEFDALTIMALQLLRLSYTVLPLSTTIELRFMQPENGLDVGIC